MGRSKHLTAEERDSISVLHAGQKSPAEIGRVLGRDRSTISRELKRSTSVFYRNKYVSGQSHGNVKCKWQESHKRKRLDNPEIVKYIRSCLVKT